MTKPAAPAISLYEEAPFAEEYDHFVRDRFACVNIAAGHHNVCAGFGESDRDRSSEALARAGNDRNLAVEPERRQRHG